MPFRAKNNPPDKGPPTHKTVRRTWGDNGSTVAGAMAGLMDLYKPKRVAKDVDLPNPDGWKGVDPRIKKLKGL